MPNNGFLAFPQGDGRLITSKQIIKTGSVITSNAGAAVVFAEPFPNTIEVVVISGTTAGASLAASASSITLSGFTAWANSGPALTCYWIAIGT